MKFIRAEGHGQGSCRRCEEKGKWNRAWMCFLYRIEGKEGCYCWDCLKEIEREEHAVEYLKDKIEELESEIKHLKEEMKYREQDIEDNYKRISVEEQL